jgi:NADPH2:quinone reductase
VSTASFRGTVERPIVTMALPDGALRRMTARVGTSMAVGNEGAGTVVAGGDSPLAQSLIGKTVSAAGGSMYSQYRAIDAAACLVLPDGTSAREGASSFVNPLTALGMVSTMRREGHTGLVHTAAASNLGQMLVKLCVEEQIPLVNIVRKSEQVELLRSIGAAHVCNSSSPSFMSDLIDALQLTGATLSFDAIGGGRLVSQTLTAMEAAASASSTQYSRYGSTTHKQAYIYGGLDPSPTVLTRSFGFAWSLGGWLLNSFLQSLDAVSVQELRERVAAGLTTTFLSHYTQEVSLAQALQPEAITAYSKQATGEKFLITPNQAR